MHYFILNSTEIYVDIAAGLILFDISWVVVEQILFARGYPIVYRESNSYSPAVTTCKMYCKDPYCYLSGECPEKVGAWISKEKGIYVSKKAVEISCISKRVHENFKDVTTSEGSKIMRDIISALQEIGIAIDDS